MSTDTLDLLRHLDTAGGMPPGYSLHETEIRAQLLCDCTGFEVCVGRRSNEGWSWWEGDRAAFIVALLAHLASMSIHIALLPGAEQEPEEYGGGLCTTTGAELRWCATRLTDDSPWHVGGPGTDGVLRAALAMLKAPEPYAASTSSA
jgi:hypothetical protein